jgi:hypothetical protein
MFQVFARSWKGLNLSPGERTFVKLVEGWGFTAVGAGGAIAFQQLTSGTTDYHQILPAAGGAALLTVVLSVKKYLASQTDLPLPAPSLAGPPLEQPLPVQPPVPLPGTKFTTPVPQPPSLLVPTPQAGGTYIAPPDNPAVFIQPLQTATTSYVPPQVIPFDRNWSDMLPSVTAQPTLPQVPTP